LSVGQELLDLPFSEVVRSLAFAIAEGQAALDRSSIETLKFLVNNTVDIIPEIAEIIEPDVRPVEVRDSSGNIVNIPVTGARIRASGASPVTLPLLQAGILPTFYQFTEAVVEAKLSISLKRSGTDTETGRPVISAFASSVNFRTANTYSYSAEGSSALKATMKPVPPPSRILPRTVTINTFSSPPEVVATPG
jgi:hypothetical protein